MKDINIRVHFLDATDVFGLLKEQINDISIYSIKKIAKKIPISDMDIVFWNIPKFTIPEIGIGGQTYTSHTVFVYLNPKFKGFKKTITEENGNNY